MDYMRRPSLLPPEPARSPERQGDGEGLAHTDDLDLSAISPDQAHELAGSLGNSATASLVGGGATSAASQNALHGPPLFSTLLETSWALEDGAGALDGVQDTLLQAGPLPWLLNPGGQGAAVGAAWLGEQTLSGLGELTSAAATGVGILETMPDAADFLDLGLQTGRMLWAGATDEEYRADLLDPSTRKQAAKQFLGNPSDSGLSLSELFEGTDADRQEAARDLLNPHKDAIIDAANANALEPAMVGALALAEQRDQRGAENVMDWFMGTVMGDGETSSGLTQVTANSARRYDLVDNEGRMTDRQLGIGLQDPATNLMAGAGRLRVGADLGAQAEAEGRNLATDDLMAPGVRVDLGVMDENSSRWDDSHRRLAIEEYTSAPFDDGLLQQGHVPHASSWWGWFGVEGYHDIQKAEIFGPSKASTP